MPDRIEPTPDLIDVLRKEEAAAANYQDSALSNTREAALRYYDREPYGDEEEGSSRVVTSEFQDVIESVMPGLMEVYCGTENPVMFMPTSPGDERWADEATDYVPYVLMKENNGFVVVHSLIKDALMYRLGGATVDLEPKRTTRTVPVEGITQDVIDALVAEAAKREGVELTMELTQDQPETPDMASEGMESMPDMESPSEAAMIPTAMMPAQGLAMPMPVATFSGAITMKRTSERVVVDNIAPEDVLFTPLARNQDKASFQGYRKVTTVSELVALGVPRADAEDVRSDRSISPEESQRQGDAVVAKSVRDRDGDSERPMWLVVAYVRYDLNDDGVSELLRCVYAHNGGSVSCVVEIMEWPEEAAIVIASPILMSHTLVGRSLFDQVQDLQQVGSVLTRGLLDNLYYTNRPRPVVSDKVNLDSLLDWAPSSPIRLKAGALASEDHVKWLQVPPVTANVLAAMEYFQTVRENRTGVVRNNQGLDAESLNKTMGGMTMMMGAAQRRQELIARTMAETALRRLYMLIYRAIKRAASGPIQYWRDGAFATVDPTQWPDDLAASVDVGLGTGGKELAVQKMMGVIAPIQEKLVALQGGGANGPYVTQENIANAAQTIAEKLGFRTPGRFFQPPSKVAQMPQQPQAPPVDPAVLQAQAQVEILREAAAADLETKRQKAMVDAEIAREKAAQQIEIERFKAIQQMNIERAKVGLKADLDMAALSHKTQLKALETVVDGHVEMSKPHPMANGSMRQ